MVNIDDILEKLGIKRRMTTQERKRVLQLKPGEKTPLGNIVTEKDAKIAAEIPGHNEARIKQYFDVAFKECIEDVRYNPIEGINCMCKKMKDEKFRDAIRRPERYIPREALLKFPEKK